MRTARDLAGSGSVGFSVVIVVVHLLGLGDGVLVVIDDFKGMRAAVQIDAECSGDRFVGLGVVLFVFHNIPDQCRDRCAGTENGENGVDAAERAVSAAAAFDSEAVSVGGGLQACQQRVSLAGRPVYNDPELGQEVHSNHT